MSSPDDLRAAWIANIVAEHGSVITDRYDPAQQRRMTFHADAWMRWNPNDTDVVWVIGRYPDGIRRTDLWDLANDLGTPAKRRRAFATTLVWGAGTTNRYYGKHATALSFEGLDAVLETTVEDVDSGDLVRAWSTAAQVPGLTFRFFTKWLWVTGVHSQQTTRPLVFDSRVRDGLRARRWPWQPRAINERQRWINYCTDAAAVGHELGVNGEWVEYWLFDGAPTE